VFAVTNAHPPSVVREALALAGQGMGQRAIARQLAINPGTVANWLAGRVPQPPDFPTCPRCDASHGRAEASPASYGYLLGMYLGDGHIAQASRVTVLRVAMDTAYPGIIAACGDAIEAVRGRRPHEWKRPESNCVVATSYWRAWPCLFPQHGPGRKHSRRIELAAWQRELVDADPRPFIRGLIHSDGWRGLNKVQVKGKDYAYPRYQFSNRSDDIRALFCQACDLLGIEWRRWGRWHVSVARRESVAKLDAFVGPKS
jgi:hypothetical protein